MSNLVDYSHEFPNALLVQGRDDNVLILSKLDEPFKRFDGKKASYELVYRWLSTKCEHEDDEAFVFVLGAEATFWQAKEIKQLLPEIKNKDEVDIFEHFNLV